MNKSILRLAFSGLLSLLATTIVCRADDGMEGYNSNSNNNDGSEYIKYWTDYMILPKRCIVYNNVDSIVFQVFDTSDHCTSEPIGTYVSPVPSYMYGHMKELDQKNADRGYDDYVEPDVAQYIECTRYDIQGTYYYLQLGCADDSTQNLAVNIYKDDQCTKRSAPEGYDDATIDVAELEVCNLEYDSHFLRFACTTTVAESYLSHTHTLRHDCFFLSCHKDVIQEMSIVRQLG
jgi:hypothetical protein